MSAIAEDNLVKLRISRAYIKLVCLPEGDVRMISLAWIGNCEIRMRDAQPTGISKEPLFVLELFDHDAQLPLDSHVCYEIAEGAAAFEAFVSR